jgi:hypothetical protein
MNKRICYADDCDVVFVPTNRNQIYCSAKCGNRQHFRSKGKFAWYVRTKNRRRAPPKKCEAIDCENVFNPTKHNQKYCSKKCSSHQYYQDNKEQMTEQNRQRQLEKKEQIAKRKREYHLKHYQPKKFEPKVCAAKDCENVFIPTSSRHKYCSYECGRPAASRKYQKEHPEEYRAYWHNRRANIVGNGGSHTAEELHDLWHKQNGFCYYCGGLLYKTLNSVYHIEHKIPISKGGSNDISNIALSCAECNFRKHDKTDEEFLEVLNNR